MADPKQPNTKKPSPNAVLKDAETGQAYQKYVVPEPGARGKKMAEGRVNQARRNESYEAQTSDEEAAELQAQRGGRVMKGTQRLFHDLYKLCVAPMKRNVAIDDQQPSYVDVEHCHFFHTVDSSGRAQKNSSPIGNHFHTLEMVRPAEEVIQADGTKVLSPPVFRCSPPKKFVKLTERSSTGAFTSKRTMVDAFKDDQHTHEVVYVGSHEVEPRKMNTEFAKFAGQNTMLAPPSLGGQFAGKVGEGAARGNQLVDDA